MLETYIVAVGGVFTALVAYIYTKDMNRLNTAIAQLSEDIGELQKLLMTEGFVTNQRCDKRCSGLTKRIVSIERDVIVNGGQWMTGKRGD